MKINLKNSSFIIFVIIAIFYAIGNFDWWIFNSPIIPQGICALHFLDVFENSFLYFNAPLITWIMKGIFLIFGKENFDLQIIIVNYFFFLIGLFFIYKIGLELKDKETGNITMILFALTPAVYGMSRQYGHQEWHVMIAMIVNIYYLIKLNYFKDWKYSMLYGITVGIGLLVKDEFLAYFFTPWLYVVVRSLIEKVEVKKLINILVTIAIGSLIAGCHYFRIEIINKILHEPIREIADIFTYKNIMMMTLGVCNELFSPIIFIAFIVGVIWLIMKFNNKNKWILLIWILVPWLIIMFMPHHKELEYNVGFIPAVILIVTLFVSHIKYKIYKTSIILILVFVLLLQFFDLSYNKKSLFRKINYHNNYNDLLFYDNSRVDTIAQLLDELKYYKKGKFFIYNTDGFIIQTHTLLLLMAVNELNVCSDIKDSDIVIYGGKERTLNDIAELDFLLSNNVYLADEKTKADFINARIEQHKILEDVFVKNFYMYKSFYLQNVEDEEYLIRLYKKKTD